MVRDLSATTTASASGTGSPAAGTPISWTVRMPLRTIVLARSVAPVKSSATEPKRIVIRALLSLTLAHPARLLCRRAVVAALQPGGKMRVRRRLHGEGAVADGGDIEIGDG